ncbi:hypothetical protein [Allomuricauda sp. R78024]|uniref:hypothetical protein n=1 Tax=Allomuricauda sp. R78024 TaxID=3093867 RepID=UPI0037CAA499
MKTIFLSISLVVCFAASGQNLDCAKFRTGSFTMQDPQTGINYVSRNDSTQVEYLPKFGVKVLLNAKWIDNCTLKLSLKEVLENPNNVPIQEFILISEIIETQKDFYIMKSKAIDMDLTMIRKFSIVN